MVTGRAPPWSAFPVALCVLKNSTGSRACHGYALVVTGWAPLGAYSGLEAACCLALPVALRRLQPADPDGARKLLFLRSAFPVIVRLGKLYRKQGLSWIRQQLDRLLRKLLLLKNGLDVAWPFSGPVTPQAHDLPRVSRHWAACASQPGAGI